MRLINAVLIVLLALMTSSQCQQTAEGWLSDLAPNQVVSFVDKGVALGDQGKYDEAIKALDEAIRLDPNYAFAWYVKGVVLRNQGLALDYPDISLDGQDRYDHSIKCFDEAIRLDPNLTQAWIDKGIALLGQGDALARLGVVGQSEYVQALECFDMAIWLSPNNAMVWRQKTIALYRTGRNAEAEAAYVRTGELATEANSWAKPVNSN